MLVGQDVSLNLGAAEIGSMLICHRDYADCRGFNPKDNHDSLEDPHARGTQFCNHRFVWG